MRSHVQGFGLLVALAVAVVGVARLAAPAVGDAFDDDGAVSTQSLEDVVDLSADGGTGELTIDEIFGIQYLLNLEGYDTGGVDGVLGPATRQAIEQAKEAYGLGEDATDRELFDHFIARRDDAADPPAPTPAADPAAEEGDDLG